MGEGKLGLCDIFRLPDAAVPEAIYICRAFPLWEVMNSL